MALPENVRRCIMLFGSPEVAELKKDLHHQLKHAALLRKYIVFLHHTYNVRTSAYERLLEEYYMVEQCRCCPRHQRDRPRSPFDGRFFPRKYQDFEPRGCHCKCRYMLRAIADEVVEPSL